MQHKCLKRKAHKTPPFDNFRSRTITIGAEESRPHCLIGR